MRNWRPEHAQEPHACGTPTCNILRITFIAKRGGGEGSSLPTPVGSIREGRVTRDRKLSPSPRSLRSAGSLQRLTAADPSLDRPSHDAALPFRIDDTQIAIVECEGDRLLLALVEMHALESLQRTNRRARNSRMR